MPFVLGKSGSAFDFDSLIDRLREAFPETTIISNDYYADRLARAKSIAQELGLADDCAPIRCIERTGFEHGTQKQLSIPISGETTLDIRIDKMGILAVGGEDTERCRTEIGKLIEILMLFPLKIETSWNDVDNRAFHANGRRRRL